MTDENCVTLNAIGISAENQGVLPLNQALTEGLEVSYFYDNNLTP